MQNNTISPGIYGIENFTLIKASGKDAVSFLHGQFTQQVKGIGNKSSIGGYCNPQGRLFATFRFWCFSDSVYLLLKSDVVDSFLKRIKMFVLRSDVAFTVLNTKLALEISEESESNLVEKTEDGFSVGISPVSFNGKSYSRKILVGVEALPTNIFEVTEILSGTPWVSIQTSLKFTPQAINLELVDGVSFRKGCYPGQEVVSRIQHIGETPKRAFIGKVPDLFAPSIGADIFDESSVVGIAVNVEKFAGSTLLLACAKVSTIADHSMFTVGPNMGPIEKLALSYVYRNVLKK